MNDETTLLPCPFCGGEAEIKYSEWVDSDDPPNTHHVWSVGCAKRSTRSDFCLGRLCQNRGFKDRDEAISAWNTRTHGTLTAEQVRDAVLENFEEAYEKYYDRWEPSKFDWQSIADELNAELVSEINGDTSDGYHTFNELYHHRAVLFSVIVRDHRELAWKARKHHDGTMYDGMFIVGIETPKGHATYHYDLDPYWEMFDCEEREFAPEWDGHTPDEAIARIAELGSGTCELNPDGLPVGLTISDDGTLLDWRGENYVKQSTLISGTCENISDPPEGFLCSECGWGDFAEPSHLLTTAKFTDNDRGPNHCPNCGRRVER